MTLNLQSAADVAKFLREHQGETVVVFCRTPVVSSALLSAADVVIDATGLVTRIIKRRIPAPPPDYDLCRGWRGLSGSWGRTGAARIRPTFLGYAVEEEYQSPDGERRWVKTDDPITIRERKQR